jgi:LytS/YehU family sensor histidine kinase
VTIEGKDECLDAKIPKFTLQPIVENSIVNGVLRKVRKGNQQPHKGGDYKR